MVGYSLALLIVGGLATLTVSGFSSIWNFSDGGVGYRADCNPASVWLNIDLVATEYKPLYWNSTQITTNWAAGYRSDLVAKGTTEYNTTSTFLACKHLSISVTNPWYLFLVTTTTVPLASAPSLKNFDVTTCVKTRLTVE